jgi:hypothetical protein
MDHAAHNADALWNHALGEVHKAVASPMVWLAMQAAQPITVDGNYFVIGFASDKEYLADSLKTFEAVSAIEDALKTSSGHILALRQISGTTIADWGAVRAEYVTEAESAPSPPSGATSSYAAPEPTREVIANWDKLNERLNLLYKTWPQVRYPHGQAQFVLQAVKHISDTMEALGPGSSVPHDDTQERNLSRLLERLSGIINLDPIFLALELYRYRQSQGK